MHWRDVLICTVGTSLKSNLAWLDEARVANYLRDGNAKGLALWLLQKDPGDRLCGAEINSVVSVIKKGHLRATRKLILLVSDTADGLFLGRTLKQYFDHATNPHRFQAVEVHTLTGLTDSDPQQFRTEGLRNLVRTIASVARRESSDKIVINATGGYKAQISFAGMIGQALEIPVCYLFERFSEVIELPPQPISLDLSFWLENIETFYLLALDEAEQDPAAEDPRFASLIDSIEVDSAMLVTLSAVGQLFHETFRHRFQLLRERMLPPAADLDPSRKIIKYEDDNKGKHPGLAGYLDKLRRIPYVVRIYTHHYNPSLAKPNSFRRSAKEEISQIEGNYSNGKAMTKFDLVTTAATTAQRDAALADLLEKVHSEGL
jgi:putative CRISPR-associated protein (TIGR02619 family)